jgi:hypothetical protein
LSTKAKKNLDDVASPPKPGVKDPANPKVNDAIKAIHAAEEATVVATVGSPVSLNDPLNCLMAALTLLHRSLIGCQVPEVQSYRREFRDSKPIQMDGAVANLMASLIFLNDAGEKSMN